MRFITVPVTLASLAVGTATAQESKAIFDAPLAVVDTTRHLEVLLDLDGDGFEDAISWGLSNSSASFSCLRNVGDGSFVIQSGTTTSGSYTQQANIRIRECNLNNDGLADFFYLIPHYTNYDSFLRVYYTNPGSPAFTKHEGLSMSFGPEYAEIADFDGDGLPDRATLNNVTSNTGVLTIDTVVPDGQGGWNTTSNTLDIGGKTRDMFLFDYNGDTTQDLCLVQNGRVQFVGVQAGVPDTPVLMHHWLPPAKPMVIPGDIDGDGDEDVVVFGNSSYRVIRRTSPISWLMEGERTGGPAAKFADVDMDGDLDGICCGGGGTNFDHFDFPSTFMISLNDGNGGFAPVFTFPGSGSREIAGAADLDHDGDADLVAGNCVYYGRGPITGSPQEAIATGSQAAQTMHDFDHDGDEDFNPGTEPFLRNLGSGLCEDFNARFPAPPAGDWFRGPGFPGDWDGDGDTDLIVRKMSAVNPASMRLFLNDGGGTYSDGGDASSENLLPTHGYAPPENSFAQDLDNDGDLDLITFHRDLGQSPTHKMWTWKNDGTGHFDLWRYRTGVWPIAFGQLWADGYVDAVLGTDDGGGAALFRGLGDGRFSGSAVEFLSTGQDVDEIHMAVADFDLDGDDDVVGAFQFDGKGWYDGNAYFIPTVNGNLSVSDKETIADLDNEQTGSNAYPTPRIALAGDVNGDGLLDAVFSCPTNRRSGISIVLRKSDNSGWEVPIVQIVYPQHPDTEVHAPVGKLVDLDGDGDVELCTDSIWKNISVEMPESGARHQWGAGRADIHGFTPTLGATGPFRVGEAAQIRVTGAPGGASGFLLVNYTTPAAPFTGGATSWAVAEQFVTSIPFTTTGTTGATGVGGWTLDYTVPPYVLGRTKVYRAILSDPNQPGRDVRSNRLILEYGN